MIVVAIIGILAAIAIPKFEELIRKSNEAVTKGNLAAVRSALGIHHREANGAYPYHPVALTAGGRYLSVLPRARTPKLHPDSDAVALVASAGGLTDAGGWAYLADPASKDYGTFVVNCTHTDTRGSAWSTY